MRYAFPMLTRLQRAGGWLLVALGLGAGLARAGDAPAGSTAAVAVVSVGHLGFKFSERAATAAVPKVALPEVFCWLLLANVTLSTLIWPVVVPLKMAPPQPAVFLLA